MAATAPETSEVWSSDGPSTETKKLQQLTQEELKRQWWPLAALDSLNHEIPNPMTVLNKRLVVWKSNGTWTAQDDVCPHKLAPLSDGFITPQGNLLCSYHGWEFGSKGECVRVPHLPPAKPIPCQCNVPNYPVERTGAVLWVWMDPLSPPDGPPTFAHEREHWDENVPPYQRDIPYAWDYLIENILDPSHVPVAHHGLQMGTGRHLVGPDQVKLLEHNITNNAVQFLIQNKQSAAVPPRDQRWTFQLPGVWSVITPNGFGLFILVTPIDDQSTRIIHMVSGRARQFVPKWLPEALVHVKQTRFYDSDAFMIRHQQQVVAETGDPSQALKSYSLVSEADATTALFRKWFSARCGGQVPLLVPPRRATPPQLPSRDQAADSWEQHGKHCVHCRSAEAAARKTRVLSLAAVVASALLSSVIGFLASAIAAVVFGAAAFVADKIVKTFHLKAYIHGAVK